MTWQTPARPAEVSRWWMPGQHTAGGETPHWRGSSHRLHHALRFGDELWAAVWFAGVRMLDASDIRNLKITGEFNYPPPFPEPTHTVAPVPVRLSGRQVAVAVDEEHDHVHGQLHGGLWFLDVEERGAIRPIGMFHLSELDSPFSRSAPRFGAHQERVADHRLYCTWFSGGLRTLDISDPTAPEEIGWYISGARARPQGATQQRRLCRSARPRPSHRSRQRLRHPGTRAVGARVERTPDI